MIKPEWLEKYNMCKDYYEETGNINTLGKKKIKKMAIGDWLKDQKRLYKKNKLEKEKIILLDKLGVVWDVKKHNWEQKYILAKKYFEREGDLDIPRNHIEEGEKLGEWISTLRKSYRNGELEKEKIVELEKLNIVWENVQDYYWMSKYNKLKKYFEKEGKLQIPKGLMIDGMKIGVWFNRQKHRNSIGKLEEWKKNLLEDLNIDWEPLKSEWDNAYDLARRYYEEHLNLLIPFNYKMDGSSLGQWIFTQRSNYRDKKLSDEKIKMLNAIEMIWEVKLRSHTSFAEQSIFYYIKKKFSDSINTYIDLGFEIDIYIPQLKLGIEYDGPLHIDPDKDRKKNKKCIQNNIKLIRVRDPICPDLGEGDNYKLQDNSEKELENAIIYIMDNLDISIDIDIDIDRDREKIYEQFLEYQDFIWTKYYDLAQAYYKEFGDLKVPVNYKVNNLYLGRWISKYRNKFRNKKITAKEIEKLDEIGMSWDFYEDEWFRNLDLVIEYNDKYGSLLIPHRTKFKGENLGIWISTQRAKYLEGSLGQEKIDMLEELGIVWDVKADVWNTNYLIAKKFFEEKGHLFVADKAFFEGIPLGSWLNTQKVNHKKGILTSNRQYKLELIGIIWDYKEFIWEKKYNLAKLYYEENKNLKIKGTYKVDDINLGKWIKTQRGEFNKGSLSEERVRKLNEINMIWNARA